MKNISQNEMKIAIKVRPIVLLLIIGLAGLICLTGITAADENYSISYDTNLGSKTSHGNLIPFGLVSDSTMTISTGGSYILDQGTFTNAIIRITATSDVVLFLNGTNITNTPLNSTFRDTSPLQLMTNSNVTLVLMDGSKNSFTCNGMNGSNYYMQSGIFVNPTAKLTIRGQSDNSGELTVNGGYYSAGIGGGPNGNPGKIVIEGGNVTANSYDDIGSTGNGAGIGGGGGNSDKSNSSAEEIIIRGKANVTAVSKGNGAGIGGGGNNNNIAGAGGTIKIYGDATVTAIGEGRGAGIGGGGSNNNTAGAGGAIDIYDNATVTATGLMNGAGIGGGGFGTTGAAGASGNIAISSNPIIVAKSSIGMGIGSGTDRAGVPAAANLITIDSGNVYADKTSPIENQYGDLLGMITVPIKTSGKEIIYKAINGNDDEYNYKATTDKNGNAFIWLPLGNQLIICVNTADTIIEISIKKLIDGLNEIEPSDIIGYITPSNQTVTWNNNAPTSLNPVIFTYAEGDVLVLKAYNSVTLAEIKTPAGAVITYTVDPVATNDYYDYSNDVAFLTASVENEYPGRYALTPQGSTIAFIHSNNANIVNVYYTPQPGSSTGGGGGHGSATVVPGENNTGGSNKSDSNMTPTRLTILCVDEKGSKLFIQSLTTVVGSSEAINAPPLKGYKLLTGETSKNIKMEAGENTITFKYAELLTGQQSDDDRQTGGKWNLSWLIFVLIFIAGITVSFLIGRRSRK